MMKKVLSLEEFKEWEKRHHFYIYSLVYFAVSNNIVESDVSHYDRVMGIVSFILTNMSLRYNILLSDEAKQYLIDKLLYDISLESYEQGSY